MKRSPAYMRSVQECRVADSRNWLSSEAGKTIALRMKDTDIAVFRWFRGQKRICSRNSCAKAAKIQVVLQQRVDRSAQSFRLLRSARHA